MRRAAPLVLALALAGCGSAESHEAVETEHAEAVATVTATSTAATTSTDHQQPALTGYGATNTAWNETHTEVAGYAHEAVYNPNSSLPEVDGREGDEYGDVRHSDGHVIGYEYHFVRKSSVAARREILAEQFPPDATIYDDEMLGTCELMLIKSRTLVRALGLPTSTVAAAQIDLETGHDENDQEQPFDPSSVDGALVTEGYPGIENIKPEC